MDKLLVEIFGPLSVAFVLLVIFAVLRRILTRAGEPRTAEERQVAREAFRARLLRPRPAEIEQAMRGLLPQRLLDLYNDQSTILSERLEITRPGAAAASSSEWLAAFLPLDLESQKYAADLPAQGWGKGFCFATDGSANFYWVPLADTRQPDSAVFYVTLDPRSNEQVAASLEEFLSWPRTTPPADVDS